MANEKFRVKYGLAVGDNTTETAMTVDGTTGDIVTLGDITVGGNDIKSNGGTTAIALSGADITTGDITLNGGDIRSSGGTVAISVSGADTTIANNITTVGDVYVNGGEIYTTASSASLFSQIPLGTGPTTVSLATEATTLSIGANTGTTTINNSLVADDISVLTVDTTNLEVTNIKAKDGTAAMTIANTTGAVNVSSSLQVDNIDIRDNTISATDTNGSINLTPNGTGSVRANGRLDVGTIRALDGTAAMTIADTTGAVNISSTLTVDNIDIRDNTISSTNTNGDILITPNGTGDIDLVSDTVQVGDTNTAATITTNGTGNLTINTNNGTNSGNIVITQGTNGNITLTPNGTGKVVVTDNSIVLGNLLASTNLNYTFPALPLTSISGNNGLDAASSMPASSLGYGAQQQFTHYFGDTFAGPLTTAVLSLKSAFGNSVTGGTVPFTGIAQTAASALVTNSALGTINYNGYATTNFTDYIGTRNQGGGFNGVHATQIQSFALENFADGTLTISGATITNAVRFSSNLSSVSVTGTKGQISFTGTATSVGTAINVTGTNSGTSTGITAGTYYVVAATSTTNITLSATPGGQPINTTAGTTTGLSFARRGVTFTYSAQTNIPFGTNALVTVANVTGVTNGTYMALGTSTTTSLVLGIDTASVSLPGTQSLSIATVTNAGTGFRVRAFPTATTMNSGNRLELIDHRASAATYRANTFTFNTGAYGNTGVGVTGNNIIYNRVYGQWQYDATITPAAADTAYAYPIAGASGVTDFANIASVGSTSRIIPSAAGMYKLQFSVQLDNADNGNDHIAYFWWRKNGTDVPASMGQVTVFKGGATIAGWDNMISSANTTDYWELMYAVSDTQLTLPYYAATAFGPASASMFITLVPVGA